MYSVQVILYIDKTKYNIYRERDALSAYIVNADHYYSPSLSSIPLFLDDADDLFIVLCLEINRY